MDNADRASERQQQEMDIAMDRLRNDHQMRTRNVSGKCKECGEPIEHFRRDWAECCVDCTRDRERWERTTGMARGR